MMNSGIVRERAVVDTNVFVYAHHPSDPQKQALAIDLINSLATSGNLIVSVQVLNEFYVRASRPDRSPGLSHEQAAAVVSAAQVRPLTWAVTSRAKEGSGRYRISFWDGLIWAVARENGVTRIYTEDLPGAPEIEGVTYVNPFAAPP